jgi:hypothetical protein
MSSARLARLQKPGGSLSDKTLGKIDVKRVATAASRSARQFSTSVTAAAKRPPHARAPHAGWMTCSGRSPGSRVITLLPPSRALSKKPSGLLEKDSPPTVAGAASDLAHLQNEVNLTEFPFADQYTTSKPEPLHLKRSRSFCQRDRYSR